MTLRAFVKGKKTFVDAGAWSDKRMPKTGGKFPLSRARSFRIGAPGWRWRVLQVECDNRLYRILLMYHPGKENYVGLIGTSVGSDLLVLGALENHSTHRGWHVHAACKSVSPSDSGRLRYDGMRRTASGSSKNAQLPFPEDDDAAFEIARLYFALPPVPGNGTAQIPFAFQPGGPT